MSETILRRNDGHPIDAGVAVTLLADLRAEAVRYALDLEKAREELEAANPELTNKITTLSLMLRQAGKERAELEAEIRSHAADSPDVAVLLPWLAPRYQTAVDYFENFAIRLALIFLPSAVKLDKKAFDKWAIANQDNPLLAGQISVDKVPGFTINSDLSEYESKPATAAEFPDPDPDVDDVPF